MNNRGQGRVFQRGSLLWIAYYAHGKEQREVARHVRTGEKLEATTEKNRHEADRFLKHRLGEIAAEKHGGRPFVVPHSAARPSARIFLFDQGDACVRSKDA